MKHSIKRIAHTAILFTTISSCSKKDSVTPTSLTVKVPEGAGTGKVSVPVWDGTETAYCCGFAVK